MFDLYFIINLLLSVLKDVLKSLNIWQIHGGKVNCLKSLILLIWTA